MATELREDCLTDGDVLVNLGAPRPLLLPDLHLLRHALLLLRGGGVLDTGVGCRLCSLFLLCGGEDLTWPLELLLGRLSITAGTPPLPSWGLTEKLQLMARRLLRTSRMQTCTVKCTESKSRIKMKLIVISF